MKGDAIIMKKLVALLCALMICLSVFSGASACGKCPDNYIASRTGNDIMRSIGEEGHQMAVEFASLCTICGQLKGFCYVYTGEIMPHTSEGQGDDQQHSQCTVCHAQLKESQPFVSPLTLRGALFQRTALDLLKSISLHQPRA